MTRLLCAFAILLLVSKPALSAPSCGEVVKDLSPCLGYLKGQDPSPSCCAGVKSMKGLIKTKDDGIAACKCAQKVLSKLTYDPKLIPPLPKKCGVELNLPPVDKNFDCSKA